jgi:hypothetical protein
MARNFGHYKKPIVLTLVPGNDTREELIAFRLKGTRETMLARVADLYRMAALWHGAKMHQARREARKAGEPWRMARKRFLKANQISA